MPTVAENGRKASGENHHFAIVACLILSLFVSAAIDKRTDYNRIAAEERIHFHSESSGCSALFALLFNCHRATAESGTFQLLSSAAHTCSASDAQDLFTPINIFLRPSVHFDVISEAMCVAAADEIRNREREIHCYSKRFVTARSVCSRMTKACVSQCVRAEPRSRSCVWVCGCSVTSFDTKHDLIGG